MLVNKKEEKQTMERYNKALGRVLRALFMFHGAAAAAAVPSVGETVNSWTNSAGEKNVWQTAS